MNQIYRQDCLNVLYVVTFLTGLSLVLIYAATLDQQRIDEIEDMSCIELQELIIEQSSSPSRAKHIFEWKNCIKENLR